MFIILTSVSLCYDCHSLQKEVSLINTIMYACKHKDWYMQQDHSRSFPTRAYALPSNRFLSQHNIPNMDSLLFKALLWFIVSTHISHTTVY